MPRPSERFTVVTPKTFPPTIGRRPWRAVADSATSSVVTDADRNPLFEASPGIAHLVVSAVNAYPKLLGDTVEQTDLLKSIQVNLRALPASPVRDRLIDLVETSLHPEAKTQ